MNTLGKEALDRQKSDEKINPIDLQREIHEGTKSDASYEEQVLEALTRGRQMFGEVDMYIVVLFKKERLLHNVIRQYFFPRLSCPTPEFDQVVYRYTSADDKLEFVWVIPDKASCYHFRETKEILPPDQREVCKFAIDFLSGELDKKCAILNKETHLL